MQVDKMDCMSLSIEACAKTITALFAQGCSTVVVLKWFERNHVKTACYGVSGSMSCCSLLGCTK